MRKGVLSGLQQILTRNLTDEADQDLLIDMNIPSAAMHAALGERQMYLADLHDDLELYRQSALSFISSGIHHKEAHRVILYHLTPHYLLSGTFPLFFFYRKRY